MEFELPLRSILPVDTTDLNVSIVPTAQIKPINGTQNYGVLIGQGPPVSRTFLFEAKAGDGPNAIPCGGTINVVFQLRDKTNELDQITVPFRLGVPRYPLAEDFEQTQPPTLPQGWTTSNTAPTWSTTTNPPPDTAESSEEEDFVVDEPPNMAVFTPANTPGQTYLTSPSFTVASAQARLYFRQAFNVSDPDDGGVLEIAIGAQPFQDILKAGGTFADDGYNTILSNNNPLGSREAWSGDSGWIPVTVNLPPAANGQQVRLRWRLGSSGGLTNGFWFIDSVLVIEPYCPSRDLVIVNPVVRSNIFSFGINTDPNHIYHVECKTNLNDLSWQFLQNVAGDGNLHTITVPAIGRHRFYRFRRD